MNSCSECGNYIPNEQRVCSMCYGDIHYGKDGYYQNWAEDMEKKLQHEMNITKEMQEAQEQQDYIVEACAQYPRAIELLQAVLYNSFIETEFDEEIKIFLTNINKTK